MLSLQTKPDPFLTAKTALSRGDLIGCLDQLDQVPTEFDKDVTGAHLRARVLSQSGQPQEGRRILSALLKNRDLPFHLLHETWCLIGRTWKDSCELSKAAAHDHLEEAILAYQNACQLCPRDPYAIINVATLSLLAGKKTLAEEYAQTVLRLCLTSEDRWVLASRAEAHAILGQEEEALRHYSTYGRKSGNEIRDLCSTRKQARLIACAKGKHPGMYDEAFDLPAVVVFSGHRVDASDRTVPRLPISALSAVGKVLLEELRKLKAGISYSSAAAGADILFLEAMRMLREEGLSLGELNIVLSCPKDFFRPANIDNSANEDGSGRDWGTRFESVLATADLCGSVVSASAHQPKDDSVAWVYANLVMSGQAFLRAKALDLDLIPVAVWNGLAGDGPGGTSDFVQTWNKRGYSPRIINPLELGETMSPEVRGQVKGTPASPTPARCASDNAFRTEIKAILFADVKHFSKLSESQVESFCRHYLGRVSSLLSEISAEDVGGPLTCNTWGDAFYMVFDSVRDAGIFALKLQRALVPAPTGTADWAKHDLPENLSIRIALHAGPVFLFSDPVVRSMSFTGRHVSFAARLEPVTPTGQIYSSESFAALSIMHDVAEFRCDYMGIIQAAKDFGFVRAYRVSSSPRP